jgi:hypothetical protein
MKWLAKNVASPIFIVLLVVGLSFSVAMLPIYAEEAYEVPLYGVSALGDAAADTTAESAESLTVEGDESWAQRQQAQQHSIPSEAVPQKSLSETASFLDVEKSGGSGGSWSVLNVALSLIGLGEAIFAIGCFFYRDRRKAPSLSNQDFMLRMLILAMAFALLIGTSISFDVTKPAVALDQMSFSIIVLFSMQQAVLFSLQRKDTVVLQQRKVPKGFRAKQRYES